MTKVVEKLYEAQEIDHRQLTRLEGQTSLLAKTTKTAFQHIDYRLLHLDTKLNYTVQHMTKFFKRTETHFQFTWETLVSNILEIHLLSSGSAMYDMVLQQYLHYYQNYDVTLDHFLTGLDALGTGRLTFKVLDPDELDHFLSAIRRQLQEERSPFELAFNHSYQFYAEPMVMFTNTHDQLLVNVPILLRLATQKPLNLYSIDTVPMPFDTETLEGKNNEYTFINNSYPYMALNEHNNIPLTETQLSDCVFYSYFQGSWKIEAFSLCMFLLLPTLREVPHGTKGTGPKFVMRPVYLRSQLRNNTNTVSVLVLLMHLLHTLYTRNAGIAHHRALQTSGRGWAGSKAVHGMECSGGALALLEIPLSRGCCLKCTVLPVQGGVLTHMTEC